MICKADLAFKANNNHRHDQKVDSFKKDMPINGKVLKVSWFNTTIDLR